MRYIGDQSGDPSEQRSHCIGLALGGYSMSNKHDDHWTLWFSLVLDAGWRHVLLQAGLAILGSALEVTGLGLAVALLLGSHPSSILGQSLGVSVRFGILILILVMLLRAGLQALMAIAQERLRSGFTDRLRQDLLVQVVYAPSGRLAEVGRGDLLALMLSDIGRSVQALAQGIRCAQAEISLIFYGVAVLVAGQSQAIPLLFGLAGAAAAGLLQRSGAWSLGRLQTKLNGALHRTVGDGLHGLKAVRAAGAEAWLLERFSVETRLFRRVLRQSVRRQAVFSCLRQALVLVVVGLWLGLGLGSMQPAALATTLLLAHRASGSLGAVISAWRLCLGDLPGYAELRQLRERLASVDSTLGSTLLSHSAPAVYQPILPRENHSPIQEPGPLDWVHWQQWGPGGIVLSNLTLRPRELTVVTGPSGSGKTTLLDGFAGLMGEEASQWRLLPVGLIRHPYCFNDRQGALQWRQFVAYAPQVTVLFEGSLRENLLLGQSGPLPGGDRQLEVWLERLGLAYLLNRPAALDGCLNLALDCFSGGEIHRLGLIRACLMNRPVEIFDEPTAFLDAQAAALVRSVLLERSQERFVLVASHDPALLAMAAQVVELVADKQPPADPCHQFSKNLKG